MKLLQTLCLSTLCLVSFQAHAELNPAQLIDILRKALPQQQAAHKQAPSQTNATTVAEQPPAAPTNNAKLDWTPLLKDWEKGCAGNATWDAFLVGLGNDKVVLPAPYSGAVGKLSETKKSGQITVRLPISGTYYGLPIKAFERYNVEDTGVVVDSLILAVPKATAQKALSKVVYRADPEMDFKAVVTSSGKDAAVVCDKSM